jgi:cbb3-type cytochrome oxidase maturation protein
MDVIYILLPVALVIVIIIIAIFFWAVRSDQFDDLEGPAHRILMDDDDSERKTKKKSPPSDKAPD